MSERDSFSHWFAQNHPFDWFAKHLGGEPIGHRERMLIYFLCEDAFHRRPRTEFRVSLGSLDGGKA